MQLRLDEARTLSGLLDMLEEYVQDNPLGPGTWLEALGWDQTRWSDTDGAFPTAVSLRVTITAYKLIVPSGGPRVTPVPGLTSNCLASC